MNFSSSVVSAFASSERCVMYVDTPFEASAPAPTAVLAIVTPLCMFFASCTMLAESFDTSPPVFATSPAAFVAVAVAFAAAEAAAEKPATMPPMLQPSCAAMIERLTMSEAASMASFLLIPYVSCR